MDKNEIIESFAGLKELKNIDRATMIRVLEDVFRDVLEKKFQVTENIDIIINAEKGDVQIWRNRTIVEDGKVTDPNLEISLSEARKYADDFEIGEEFSEEIKINSFERRAIQNAKVNLQNKLLDIERNDIIRRYQDRIDEIVTGEVYRVWKKEVLVLDDDGNELVLPKALQIPKDYFSKGDQVRAIVHTIENMSGIPRVILSRVSPVFLERLFELEVPEIADGLVSIRAIVREPGERAKVAVESYDDRIDPVGACVGMKGSRIHGIVRELRNENIDIINYTDNISLYISRALSPAKTGQIIIDQERKRCQVYLKPDQVSLAIGKDGINIKLAAKLTGYEIDIFREVDEGDYDIEIDEFADEIDPWIIDEIKNIGCDTAKSVLSMTVEEVAEKTDLEIETVEYVFEILKKEFE
ncbi:MAG TPA: transcription termination factor NusA [Bacteroidia bacterium]|nr:transcription termination/antitermination protein NusA [Sphingobacteriales bacterium]HPD63951.1 transcription termination factor NusA [Bacteroidia bacterium]HRS57688.1 transcription termination factor NusA [Bacteroidia bacterium]HRU67097.1 transcription termination factor NusA [Bacteroidia bacterium]